MNLDPAAETFEHSPDLDIKPPIPPAAVTPEAGHGPHRGLLAFEEHEEDASADLQDKDTLMRGTGFRRLNKAVAELIESFSMISYLKLDVQDEDSVGAILSYIDDCIQYHEAQEPKELKDEEFEEVEE